MTLFVCGVRGAGKTAFCNEVTRISGMPSLNLGNCLVDRLIAIGVEVHERKDVGKQYLDYYGIEAYVELVASAAANYELIDGLRLFSPLEFLTGRGGVYVVWKEAPREIARLDESDFTNDLLAIRQAADYVIPWVEDAQSVPIAWRSPIEELLQVSS